MANAPDKILVYCDVETHNKLKQLAVQYDTTMIELLRELVDSEYKRKLGG